jgi:hypothetical protein
MGATESTSTGEERFNETGSAVKRQKVESLGAKGDTEGKREAAKAKKVSGPFIDESDSEDEGLDAFKDPGYGEGHIMSNPTITETDSKETANRSPSSEEETARKRAFAADVPPLVREATSHMQDDDYPDFDEIDGDEEGGLLDIADEEAMRKHEAFGLDTSADIDDSTDDTPACPVCQGSLKGFDEGVSEATRKRNLSSCSYRRFPHMSMTAWMGNLAPYHQRHRRAVLPPSKLLHKRSVPPYRDQRRPIRSGPIHLTLQAHSLRSWQETLKTLRGRRLQRAMPPLGVSRLIREHVLFTRLLRAFQYRSTHSGTELFKGATRTS